MRSCALFNMRIAARVLTQLYDDCLRPSGLRSTQFGLLMAVRAFEPSSMAELAGRNKMDRTTLTRNLQLLEEKGLVKVDPGEDNRVRQVRLTDRGREQLGEAISLWEKAQARVIEGLGEERFSNLLKELSELVSSVEKP
ncbi:MarR family winged helix-turn-helix transcriptional regulator [Thermodesulfobacteriota bacterium]